MHSFKIGDYVMISSFTEYWEGCFGYVVAIDNQYVYVDGTDKRFDPYRPPDMRYKAGWYPSSLIHAESEYDLACQVLGEGYFA